MNWSSAMVRKQYLKEKDNLIKLLLQEIEYVKE